MTKFLYKDTVRAQTIFIFLAVGTVLLAVALVMAIGAQPSNIASSASLIIDAYKDYIAPKPTERLVFGLLAVTIPVLAVVVTLKAPNFEHLTARPFASSLPWLVALMLYLPFLGSDFVVTLLGRYGAINPHMGLRVAASLVVAIGWCVWFARVERVRLSGAWRGNALLLAWLIFGATVLLQLLSWRVVSFASVTRSGVWSTHADPVFFALSQVVAGKTLLADLPSQYGLFPHMLAPLFCVVGLSVLKLSVLFALMQVASMAGLFFVTSKLVRSRLLLLLAGLALVMVTFETVLYFAGIDERYYQYWPIRFFWPAMSVLVFYWFACRRTLLRCAAVSLLSAIGLLWNVDSGLFIVVAFGAYLVAQWAMILFPWSEPPSELRDRWTSRSFAAAIAIHAVVATAVVSASLAVMVLKAGGPLNLRALFEYQRIFIELGLMMLPLPTQVHPWMSVLGVYLAGLVVSLGIWRRRGAQVRADVMFYLSMLGLGLFVYYAGRAHILNLVTVCWPAVLLAACGADDLLRGVRAKVLPRVQLVLPVVAVAMLLLAAASFVSRVPFLLTKVWAQLETHGQVEEPFVASELDLIRAQGTGKRECLILSQRQGIYYAESGLASPLKGPGIVEILLKSDQQAIVEAFVKGRLECVFLGVGGFSNPGLNIDLGNVLANYEIKGRNTPETMLFLQAKP